VQLVLFPSVSFDFTVFYTVGRFSTVRSNDVLVPGIRTQSVRALLGAKYYFRD
jgi:hypothetical protein